MTPRVRAGSLAGIIVLALLVASCADGEEFLTDPGPGLDWVSAAEHRPPPSSVPLTTVPVWRATNGLDWVNDGLVTSTPDDPPALVAERVYVTSSGTDRYVQSAAADIAAALPGIHVPAEVPSVVSHVSSQLVFDVTNRRLGEDPAAAFGFWIVEPYTQSRSVGQRAVLHVSLDAASEDQLLDASSVCQRFSGRGACEAVLAGERPAWWLVGDDEVLVWYEPPHRYELEVRSLDRAAAEHMAATLVPLSAVALSSGVATASG